MLCGTACRNSGLRSLPFWTAERALSALRSRVDDFNESYARMTAAGVTFVSAPRTEPYGRIAVSLDPEGNRWDLLGPAAEAPR